ncbi:MAG TPA: hypothetical protein DEV93_16345 [Chloroflexi bacterium]|nr:hypothetical protein [Chloroflexota bacterium]
MAVEAILRGEGHERQNLEPRFQDHMRDALYEEVRRRMASMPRVQHILRALAVRALDPYGAARQVAVAIVGSSGAGHAH